jgi:hypothetical protein
VIVISDEADSLGGYVLIEFIPIGGFGLDDQAALHRRRIIELDFLLHEPLGDQHTGVFPPLFRKFALWGDDLVEVGARRDSKREPVIGFRVLRLIMISWHDRPLLW